jgi:hypothetical protein
LAEVLVTYRRIFVIVLTVIAVIPSVGIIVACGLLVGKGNPFTAAVIPILVITAIVMAAWVVCYLTLARRYKVITWGLLTYDSKLSVNFAFIILTAALSGIIAFCFIYEATWALLGIFLDPHWAIPLVSMYPTYDRVSSLYFQLHFYAD